MLYLNLNPLSSVQPNSRRFVRDRGFPLVVASCCSSYLCLEGDELLEVPVRQRAVFHDGRERKYIVNPWPDPSRSVSIGAPVTISSICSHRTPSAIACSSASVTLLALTVTRLRLLAFVRRGWLRRGANPSRCSWPELCTRTCSDGGIAWSVSLERAARHVDCTWRGWLSYGSVSGGVVHLGLTAMLSRSAVAVEVAGAVLTGKPNTAHIFGSTLVHSADCILTFPVSVHASITLVFKQICCHRFDLPRLYRSVE